ncbi:MAG: UDP-4-amino-4,6-dideoxy-N-acetyl-beta-L-altrosamine transaminase [Acetobacterales bacterium]
MSTPSWGDGPVPYGFHEIDEDDIAAVVAVLRSPRLTAGPMVPRFEAALAEVTGAEHVIAVANGTAALHLTALGLGLGPGDAVVVPALTFVATANGPAMTGAEVRFADVDPRTGLMTPETLEEALARTGPGAPRAVYVTQLNGAVADMDGIAEVAAAHDLPVIEDACHALGTRWRDGGGAWHLVGDCARSSMSVFSFHPVKTIATGEGGAVTTNDPMLAHRLRLLGAHGLERDPGKFANRPLAFDGNGEPLPWYYEQQVIGHNYRISDMQCALGLSQLGKLPRFAAERRRLTALYTELLAPLAPAVTPVLPAGGPEATQDPCPHIYPVRIDFAAIGTTRQAAMRFLAERGVGTQVHYVPVHRQAYWQDRYGPTHLPGADRYFKEILTLPLHTALGEERLRGVVDALATLTGRKA